MAKSITAPVGRLGALNLMSDVKVVQELLNQVPMASGGPNLKLIVNGNCGTDTNDAIQCFQMRHFGFSGADGRVDPGGPTLKKLNEFDTPGSPGTLPYDAGQLIGKIERFLGSVDVVSFAGDGQTRQPARVGMTLRSNMLVRNNDHNSGVWIRLASGQRIAMTGSAVSMLTFDSAH
jgi:hypothetical protein